MVTWYKQDGQLPYNTEIQGGDIHIHNLQIPDSGIYICQAINNQTLHTYDDKIAITVTSKCPREDDPP